MIVVVDASAMLDLLLDGAMGHQVRRFIEDERPHLATVAHVDAEVLGGLARTHRAGLMEADEVGRALGLLGALAVPRLPIGRSLLRAAWSLRDNVAARDGLYVAAAQAHEGRLLTTDDRLARAVPDLVLSLD